MINMPRYRVHGVRRTAHGARCTERALMRWAVRDRGSTRGPGSVAAAAVQAEVATAAAAALWWKTNICP